MALFAGKFKNQRMEFNKCKEMFRSCPDLKGLDEQVYALLFWRGEEKTFASGTVIYAEGAPLDDTFCFLEMGDLVVEKTGHIVGHITESRIFGEMAYLTRLRERTATVRVNSPEARVFQIQLTAREMATAQFSGLKSYLGLQAWDRFVSGSQETWSKTVR